MSCAGCSEKDLWKAEIIGRIKKSQLNVSEKMINPLLKPVCQISLASYEDCINIVMEVMK